MIRSLELNNFKKHSSLDINFEPGLNGIFGPNYTGKTTILYAILYALGGASHVPGTNLQKKGTNVGMGVTMVFDIKDTVYRVERKKSGAYLYVVGSEQMIASGTSNVTAKIEELIGMSIKRFRQLKYAEQKQAHALLTVGATELHKILEELTGIDQINNVMDKLKDIVSHSAGALESLTEIDLEPIRALEKQFHNDTINFELSAKDAAEVKRKMKLVVDEAKEDVEALSDSKEAYDEWRVFHSNTTASIQLLEDELKSLQDRADPQFDDEIYENLIKDDEADLEIKLNAISASKAKRVRAEDLRGDVDRLKNFIGKTKLIIKRDSDDLETMPDVTEELVAKAEKKMRTLEDQHRKADLKYSDILTMLAGAKCPTCGRDNDVEFDASHLEEVSKDLSNEIDQLVEKCNEATSYYQDQKRFLSVKEQLEEDLLRNVSKLNEETSELYLKLDKISELEEDAMSAEELIEAQARARGLRDGISVRKSFLTQQVGENLRRQEVTGLLKVQKTTLEQFVKPDFDQTKLDEAKKAFQTYTESLLEADYNLAKAEADLTNAQHELKMVRQRLQRAEQDNLAYETAKKRHTVAKELQKYLRNNRDRYIGKVWDFFLGSASTFVSNCTNGMITEIQRTENGQFQFVEEDEVMGIKDASGAQEAIMGLAVQMALAEASQCPLDVLLVDEPTADMDADHSMAVVGMLSTKGHQVIAISHREMDASLCKNVVLLGEK